MDYLQQAGMESKGNASSSWKPPKARTFKVNIDGASKPGTAEGSIAWVCHDSVGRFLNRGVKSVAASLALLVEALNYTLSPQDELHSSPQNEEDEALKRTLSPLNDKVETDRLLLVNELPSPQQLTWELTCLLKVQGKFARCF
ncbi:hypothetical protein NL676_038651 [Syzygium grande]|nr:hypothetical protein NL676_038651 [Syzygium grande]